MKKRINMLSLLLILVLAFSQTAFAEDRQGESGWEVRFDGKRMNSNFSTAKIDDQIGGLQPGDSIELTITLKSDFDGKADWYMRNQVLEALEDAGNITGGAYDYLLTYTDGAGELTTLYSSENFGGEGRYNGVGLHGATTTLDDYFYLDRMGRDDTGVIKLKVRLEPETSVNKYQNTLARLQMDFATEVVDDGSGSASGRPVRTGDQSRILLYSLLTLAAGLVLLITAITRLRGEQEEASVMADAPKRRRTGKRRMR